MANSPFEYTTTNEGDKIVIKAEGKVPTMNKILMGGVLIWFVGYAFFQLGLNPNIPKWVFPFVLLLGAIGGGIGIFIGRKVIHKNLSIRTITIDKANKMVEAPNDGFSAKFTDIKDVTLAENKGLMRTSHTLKLHLTSGEKTLLFPLDTYNRAVEIQNLLKDNIK